MRHITIKGNTYPFRLSYRALKASLRETGLSLSDFDNLDLEHIAVLSKEAINAGYKYEDKKETVSLDWVEDRLDEDFAILNQISEAIGEEMKTLTEPKEAGAIEKK